jgi:hypothetical protein
VLPQCNQDDSSTATSRARLGNINDDSEAHAFDSVIYALQCKKLIGGRVRLGGI